MSFYTHALLAALLTASVSPAQETPKPGCVVATLTTTTRLITRGPLSQAELVAYLEPEKKLATTGKGKTVEVNQKKLKFDPRVLPIQVGTAVKFRNSDKVTHNVFIDTDCCKVDADMQSGKDKTQVFAKAGAYPVVCRLHPEMSMTIIALDTPFFATAKWVKNKKKNAAGKRTYQASFTIKDVPPGKYTLRTWNKKLEPISHPVTITAGGKAPVELQIKK